eukprot:Phypoly_transcript_00474.p1 GENE.Phypoly_transcript_00474~~Phypoly_transcript_00474.p1  ORF type:complete len:1464 (+),score=272.40 Phypoly_transcript_00474:155-4546(+)
MRALWDNIRFNKPKNKYSLEHLKYLYSILSKNPIINEQNKVIIIETLRQIAELLIWGDQHNSVFFDYFLEKNLLSFFLNILDQKTSKNVKVQLLQTLSILIENIRAQNSLYYLFSNNHVNELIIHRFDFSDEEVLAYYISLLKTLSLKLDRSTIQFFFNAQENDFPLYTEAIKFFNHEEGMIRIAVRTLTLNVYRVEDEAMRKYILNSTAVPYFSNIVWFIRQQCHTLDQMVRNSSHDNRRKLDDFVAEMLDHFYYLHDIFCLGIESMSLVLSEQLLHYLLTPLLVESLGAAKNQKEEEGKGEDDKKISPVLALFLLAQVFTVFTHKPLINTLAAALIHPEPDTFSNLKQLCPVGPPPPLSDLAPKRTHYVSFRRFSSVPNLEVLESLSLKGTQSAPPSPVPPASHDTNAIAIKSPRNPTTTATTTTTTTTTTITTTESNNDQSKFISPSPSKSSPSLLSLDSPSQGTPVSDIPIIQVEDYSQIDPNTIPTSTSAPLNKSEESPEKRRNIHRDALLEFFEDDRTALNALCMLVALIKNEAVSKSLLEIGGLFPYRLTKAKYLLDILTNSSAAKSSQIPTVNHLKEEQHHSRSKSDSHAIAVAITDLNLRRKALANNAGNTSGGSESTNGESTSGTNTTTDSSPNLTPELSEGGHSTSLVRPLRSISQVKKPLPPLPGREESPKQAHQHAFTHSLIGRLLNLLVKSNHYRLVTLQLTLMMLKELVCSPDSPPGLTPRQLATFEKAYRVVSDIFERKLSSEIFLELFDVEVKNYKPPNFEFLIKDATLLLPVSGTSKSRLELARRLPSGETEMTQQAIQQYLVLRELKYTILNKKDDVLPHLKQHIPTISVFPKDQYTIDSTGECIVIPFVVVLPGPTVLKKRQKRLLVVNTESLIVLDPTTSAPPKPQAGPQSEEVKMQQPGHNNAPSGTVVHAAPLQSINIEIDHNDPLSLHVTSHPTTWSMSMVFEDDKKCQAAYELLMVARNELRDARIHKIRTLLATSGDKSYVSTNTPNASKIHDGSLDVSDDGIDSIIHRLESINKGSNANRLLASPPQEDNNISLSGFASDLDTTDLTEQTTERIDLTEDYSDSEAPELSFTELHPATEPHSTTEPHLYADPTPSNSTLLPSAELTHTPAEPLLNEVAPIHPIPTESTPTKPTPTESTPSESTPTESTPIEPPSLIEQKSSKPSPTDQNSTKLTTTESTTAATTIEPTPFKSTTTKPLEPTLTEPLTEPTSTEPTSTEPTPTNSTPTETLTKPPPTELTPTEPTPTEPTPTESTPTEPIPTEPIPTEPTPTESNSTSSELTPSEPTISEPTLVDGITKTSSPLVPLSTNSLSDPNPSLPLPQELNFAESSPSKQNNPDHLELTETPSPNGKAHDHPLTNGYPNHYVHNEELPPQTDLKLAHLSEPHSQPNGNFLHPLFDSTDLDPSHNLLDDIPLDEAPLSNVPLTPPPVPNGIVPH